MHVLVTGGGSGGHVIPAIPVMEALRAQGDQVSFVGTTSGYEERLLEGVDVGYHGISSGKLRRYFSFENLKDVFKVLLGIVQAFFLVRRLRPDVIFSKGGFVAFPVVFAGWLRKVPVIGHESDFSPGLANRLSRPFVRTLCTSFPETRIPGFSGRVAHTGSPLRPEFLAADADRGRARFGLSTDRPVLVVIGGSLGARKLNEVVRAAVVPLTKRYAVVHICGPGNAEGLDQPGYCAVEFVSEGLADLLLAADIVISRAGANSLFELLTLGKLCLLVPLSAAASRGDQIENARYAESRGYSLVIDESALRVETLMEGLIALERQADSYRERLATFERKDAVALLLDEISVLVAGSR
jgi:UDP-N-acetylglucosamine--N-acetylmuramyl-(pentapeptide) pyrophosphoryl-undecaprenol N-acetylglucosamine transferase